MSEATLQRPGVKMTISVTRVLSFSSCLLSALELFLLQKLKPQYQIGEKHSGPYECLCSVIAEASQKW